MSGIVERLRAATEPSRELDAEIAEYLGHKVTWSLGGYITDANGGPVIHWQKPHQYAGMEEPCPRFTSSLDTAWILPGPGYEWLRKSPETMTVYRTPAGDKEWAKHHDAVGATPALALCIAALLARGIT